MLTGRLEHQDTNKNLDVFYVIFLDFILFDCNLIFLVVEIYFKSNHSHLHPTGITLLYYIYIVVCRWTLFIIIIIIYFVIQHLKQYFLHCLRVSHSVYSHHPSFIVFYKCKLYIIIMSNASGELNNIL